MLAASNDLKMFRNRCSKTSRKPLQLLLRLALKWRALRIPNIEGLIAGAEATSSAIIPRGPIVSAIVKSLVPRPWQADLRAGEGFWEKVPQTLQ